MAEPADRQPAASLRDLAEKMLPHGGVSRERLDEAVEALVERGRLTRDDADALLADVAAGSRGAGHRLTDRASGAVSALADQIGLVRQRELDELELRVAQLEHRLRLLEREADGGSGTAPP